MHVSLPQHPKKVYRSNFNIRIQRSSPWKFFLEFVNSKEPKKEFCISPLLLISDNDILLKKISSRGNVSKRVDMTRQTEISSNQRTVDKISFHAFPRSLSLFSSFCQCRINHPVCAVIEA